MEDNAWNIAHLEGQIILLQEELARKQETLDYFAKSQDYWRRQFLEQNPDLNTWDYVDNVEARILMGDLE